MQGSGKESISFKYINDRGDVVVRKHPFEGILNNMDRRYRETESNAVREELAKYINTQSCNSCGGSRLREEARNVFIEDLNLPVLTQWSIGEAMDYFSQLQLSGQRAQIAEKSSKKCATA